MDFEKGAIYYFIKFEASFMVLNSQRRFLHTERNYKALQWIATKIAPFLLENSYF